MSTNGAKLKPRAEMQPGTPVEVQLQPPDDKPFQVSGLVWRLEPDSMAVMFLRSLPVQVESAGRRSENGRRGWR